MKGWAKEMLCQKSKRTAEKKEKKNDWKMNIQSKVTNGHKRNEERWGKLNSVMKLCYILSKMWNESWENNECNKDQVVTGEKIRKSIFIWQESAYNANKIFGNKNPLLKWRLFVSLST